MGTKTKVKTVREKWISRGKKAALGAVKAGKCVTAKIVKGRSWVRSKFNHFISGVRRAFSSAKKMITSGIVKIRGKVRKYHIYCFVMCALGLALVSSVVVELLTGSSISDWIAFHIHGAAPVFHAVRSVVTVEATLKAAETIGFSSIFIAWIYAALDKTDLGHRYGDLLRELYPEYHWFVLGHLIALLMCLWMSKVSKLESALLALSIIVLGCMLQWKALQNIVLFSEKRRKVAIDRWDRMVSKAETKTCDCMLLVLFDMADAISLGSDQGQSEMRDCFSKAFLKYVDRFGTDKTQCMQGVMDIWDRLLKGREKTERLMLIQKILKNCVGSRGLGCVCIGYALWLYEACVEKFAQTDEYVILEKIRNDILILEQRVSDEREQAAFFYWDSTFTLIVMMQFLCGNIEIYGDLLGLRPNRAAEGDDQELLAAAMGIIFEKRACENYLSCAMDWLFVGSESVSDT